MRKILVGVLMIGTVLLGTTLAHRFDKSIIAKLPTGQQLTVG